MAWTFEFTRKAQKQFDALDSAVQSRIKQAVTKKLVVNPRAYLIPLHGDRAGLFKFRVGAYRLLCSIDDDRLYVVVVKVKHRQAVYRR